MNTNTPTNLLIHYIADEDVVTAHDVAGYFDVTPEQAGEALKELANKAILDEDGGTYEISATYGGDPDDAIAAMDQAQIEAEIEAESPEAPDTTGDALEVTSDRVAALEATVGRLESLVASLSAEVVALTALTAPAALAATEPATPPAATAAAPSKKKKAAAAPLAAGRKRATKKRLPALVSEGAVPVGSEVSISLASGAKATARIVDGKHVESAGQNLRITDWAKGVTGWSVVNIYANVRVADGRTLEEVRSA